VPLVVNHDLEREIGTVHEIFPMEWVDGRWIVASCTLDDPPGWIERGTRASFEFRPLNHWRCNGWWHVRQAIVEEVTIVGPGHKPVNPSAEVLSLWEEPAFTRPPTGSPVAVRGSSDRAAAAGEVIHHDRSELLVRPGIGQVIGVR